MTLRRRKGLRRTGPPKRRAPLGGKGWGKRGDRDLEKARAFDQRGRQPLKRRSRRSQKPALVVATNTDCWPARFFPGTPCGGPAQDCHIGLTKQTLGKHWDKQEWGRRNGLAYNAATLQHTRDEFRWLPCWVRRGCWDHHQALDGPNFKLERNQVPDSVEGGAAKYGLTHRLDRDYGPREPLIARIGKAA